MNKKPNPRTSYIIVRVTPLEKEIIAETAIKEDIGFSEYIREKLGLKK